MLSRLHLCYMYVIVRCFVAWLLCAINLKDSFTHLHLSFVAVRRIAHTILHYSSLAIEMLISVHTFMYTLTCPSWEMGYESTSNGCKLCTVITEGRPW